MPNLESHEAVAIRNQVVLDELTANLEHRFVEFAPWVISVAFYKALHLVEGILFIDGIHSRERRPIHSQDHTERKNILRRNRYANLWKHYRPLYEASMVARYLCDTSGTGNSLEFSEKYIKDSSILDTLIRHHLHQIQRTFDERKSAYKPITNTK